MTQILSGVVIPDKLLGADDEENNVDNDETEEDDTEELSGEVYDQGINILSNLMAGEKFDGFDIKSVPVFCDSNEIYIDGKKYYNGFYTDYDEVKRFYSEKLSREKAKRDPVMSQILKESLLIHRHMDRRLHSIIFRKCNQN